MELSSNIAETAAYGRGGIGATRSATNVVYERRNYPLLRSQMSDPGDCVGIRSRCAKRDSSGKSLMDFTGEMIGLFEV